MKFGIVTINYRRQEILKLFCKSMARLRKDTGIDFPVVCVSEEADKKLCEKHNIHHITQGNYPVSRKWNTGSRYMRDIGCDYIVITGSDDIISTDLFKKLIVQMEKGISFIGLQEIYFFGTYGRLKNRLYHVKFNSVIGVCRVIHRSVLDKVDWKLCNVDKNFGMDGIMLKNIRPHITTRAIVDGMVVDVKSAINLNSITFWATKARGVTLPNDTFYNILSEEEIKVLNTL